MPAQQPLSALAPTKTAAALLLIACAFSLVGGASAQTVIKTGSNVDWEFAFIITACLAAFLFIIVIIMAVYIRITVKAHKVLRDRRGRSEQSRNNSSTSLNGSSLMPARHYAQMQRVPRLSSTQSSVVSAPSTRSEAMRNATKEAWISRVSALDNLTDSQSVTTTGTGYDGGMEENEDFNKILNERLDSVTTDDAGDTHGGHRTETTTAQAQAPTDDTNGNGEAAAITMYDFGDAMTERGEDDFDWPQPDSDGSESYDTYDFQRQTASSVNVRLRRGADDDEGEEVAVTDTGTYVDIQGVSRSENSTALSTDRLREQQKTPASADDSTGNGADDDDV